MIGAFGIGAFFVVGSAVSLRLLLLWRRTGAVSELLAALGLLGIGPFGFCLMMSGLVIGSAGALARGLALAGLALQAAGFVAAAAFTWRVCRPRALWACALTAVISVGLLATFLLTTILPIRSGSVLLHHHVDVALKVLCLSWGAAESLRYWRLARRRVVLGLADPVVAASFGMLALALGAGALGFVLIDAALVSLHAGEHLGPGVELILSLCGITASAGLYLAFAPPRAWARWLTSSAPDRVVRSPS